MEDKLRSDLISAKSLVAETEMLLDYVRQNRATKYYAQGHIEYLADEIERSRKELQDSSPVQRNQDAKQKSRTHNPHGKTRASRRHALISEHMFDLLMLRCAGKTKGWLFPSERAASGHLTTVAKQFREARLAAGLPDSLILYSARHIGTAVYEATSNLALVVKAMGHSDVRTAMRYQHPALDSLREVIDQRNLRHNPRQNELRVQ